MIVEKGHFFGNCPIEASHLDIVKTYSAVESNCPVVTNGIDVIGTLTISNQLPIIASHSQVNETYIVMGNRLVAPNEVGNSELLMEFLD
ncbi:MAG: hypothetical protein ACQJCO_07920 [cyanobacterium endosymbiont of Rhopalodia sterrenbergii]